MNETTNALDQTVMKLLQSDPRFAEVYLSTALEEMNESGGRFALLAALRQIAEFQGMAEVAARAGIKRESLYRALSPKGNPTIKTLLAVTNAVGFKLTVQKREAA